MSLGTGRLPTLVLCALVVLLALLSFSTAEAQDYVIQPDDEIAIKVFQEDDLETEARVSKAGTIIMPLIGNVKVAGLTTGSATRLISSMLKNGYLVNPQVSVQITKFDKKTFTVLGQVTKPNTYIIPGGKTISLLEAIGVAGGFTRVANMKSVTLRRKSRSANEPTIYTIDATRIISGKGGSADLTIRPGDVITVAERRF